MNDSILLQKVEDAIAQKITNREAFTTVDISHPIIAEDSSVRHRDVRKAIDQIINRGELDDAMFTSSPITVWPQANKSATVRLFHPDEPTFDPSSYTATHQELVRGPVTTRGYDMTDTDGDDGSSDGVNIVTTTQTGAKVTKQCCVQKQQDTINVPVVIVKNANFEVGDPVKIEVSNGSIIITKSIQGTQKVDNEGRIRLHGKNIAGRQHGSPCTAMVVDDGDDTFIQIE